MRIMICKQVIFVMFLLEVSNLVTSPVLHYDKERYEYEDRLILGLGLPRHHRGHKHTVIAPSSAYLPFLSVSLYYKGFLLH